MTDKEAMQMALDALESWQKTCLDCGRASDELGRATKPLQALRAALAQPEPEPVAWTVSGLITDFSRDFSAYKTKTYTRPLYTAPPQREWVGLTDDDLRQIILAAVGVAEAKLKEKNT